MLQKAVPLTRHCEPKVEWSISSSEDERGHISFPKNGSDVEVGFQTIHKGKARAGHTHTYEEEFYVISGKVLFISRDSKRALLEPKVFKKGDKIKTTPNEAHMILALEESALAMFKPKGDEYKPEDDPELKKIVDILRSS